MLSLVCGNHRRHRLTGACLVLAALALVLSRPAAASFGGEVRDSGGRLLEQVEVFLFDDPGGTVPVAFRFTDDRGRFRMSEVDPGHYRIAAVKDGYRLYLGRVDTILERTVRLVLHPKPRAGEEGSEIVPVSAAWALRLPRRSLLRETDRPPVAPGNVAAGAPRRHRGIRQMLAGEFSHAFEARARGGAEERLVDAYGLETGLRLTGFIAENASLTLAGSRRRMEDENQAELRAGLRFDPGPDDRIETRAHWGSRRLEPGRQPAGWTAWGAATRWDRTLGDSARMAWTLDYREHAVPGEPEAIPADELILDGEFQVLAGSGHRLLAGFEARGGGQDRVFTLRSEDTWSVSGPLTLIYGLGYRERSGFQPSGTVRPVVGAVWSTGPLVLRLQADYAWAVDAGAGEAGHEAGLELVLPAGFRLQGEVSRDPAADGPGPAGERLGGALVRSYGDVNREARSATLLRDGPRSRIALTFRDGVLQGYLGTAADHEFPPVLQAGSELEYGELELAFRFPGPGTELSLGVRESRAGPTGTMGELVSVHLAQDLSRPVRGPAWRLAVTLLAEDRYVTVNTGVVVAF